ncbi:MAG: LTA synthase family protein, partial [Prevotellaceae bacterium]|nr:LTA synthase family protein [Prevotellaceae bacterium]
MNRILSIVKPYTHVIVACLYNICLSYLLLFLARVLFYAINYSYFADLSGNELWAIWRGGLSFDTAAIGYLDSLYILLMLIPLHYKENKNYQLTAKIVFICFNGVGLIMNLADAVYFQYTNRRTTASIFSEFQH